MGDAFLIGQGKAGGASTADKIKLTQDTADLYGLTGDDANVDVALARGRKWQLLQEYKTAGTYNWTAPDLFNGEDYEIGVWMCGGGCGAEAIWHNLTSANLVAFGGTSGSALNLRLIVLPGQTVPIVVGEGGQGGVRTKSPNVSTPPTVGGSSSFNGTVVEGGGVVSLTFKEGGIFPLFGTVTGVSFFGSGFSSKALAKYLPYTNYSGSSSVATIYSDMFQLPQSGFFQGYNAFDGKYYLASGGSCYTVSNKSAMNDNFYQIGTTVADGKAGDSNWAIADSVSGENATGSGCGGGAAIVVAQPNNDYNAYGGDGADGAVMIFV